MNPYKLPDDLIAGTTRSVTILERDGQPARGVTLERDYDTSADDVWDALTNPDRLNRWFAPVSGDFELGGRYAIEGNASGSITNCVPPFALSLTWEFGGGMSWVDVRVEQLADGRTHLTLCHICPVDDDFWPTYGPGAVGVGWDLGVAGLTLHLSDPAFERFDEVAFLTSDAGKAVVDDLSADWGRAAVESGDDVGHAREAASRTAAFYKGET